MLWQKPARSRARSDLLKVQRIKLGCRISTRAGRISRAFRGAPLIPRDPTTRFLSGFDRWDKNALRRSIIWRWDKSLHRVDAMGGVWWWDCDAEIWWILDDERTATAWRDHAAVQPYLRRAVPIIRLFIGAATDGERFAAYRALRRIGRAITDTWRETATVEKPEGDCATYDHASSVYSEATDESNFHEVIWYALSQLDRAEDIARSKAKYGGGTPQLHSSSMFRFND